LMLYDYNISKRYANGLEKSQFRKVNHSVNFSKMICKKLLDFIEYKDELCALN